MNNREINTFPALLGEVVPKAMVLLMQVSELNRGDLNNVARTCLFFSKHAEMRMLLQNYREFDASEKLMTLHFDNESELNLKQFLNNECKRMVQLGAATGNFLKKYKNEGWNVVGYDYSSLAVKEMTRNNVPAKIADLNEMDPNDKKMLACDQALKNDLVFACNIVAMRIFNHLNDSALLILLNSLIDYAKIGSVIFIVDPINPGNKISEKYKLLHSFFSTRKDTEILSSYETQCPAEVGVEYMNKRDHLLVAKKR